MHSISYWLSVAFLFTVPWEATVEVAGVGTITRALGLVLAVVWAMSIVVGSTTVRRPHAFHYMLLAYVLWNSLSVIWTIDVGLTRERLHTYPQLLTISYILWTLYRDADDFAIALKVFALGFWVNAGSLVANFMAGVGEEGTSLGYAPTRFAASGFGANNNGVVLAIGIPVAWYLFTRLDEGSRSEADRLTRLLKLVYLSYIPAAVFGILITASRAAAITSIPALLFVLLSKGRLNVWSRIAVVPVLVAAVFLVQSYVPNAARERLLTTSESIATGDLNGRMELWRLGFDAFRERPVLGIGSHAFRAATSLGKVDHNTYLSVLFELGMIGFTIFALVMATTVMLGLRLRGPPKAFWLTTLVVLGIGVLTLNWKHRKLTWLIPSMIVVQTALVVTDPKRSCQYSGYPLMSHRE
jgi:hypothetical protein